MSCDKQDMFERRKNTNFYLEATTCKVSDAQSDINDFYTKLHRYAVSSYESYCRCIGGALADVSKCVEHAFNGVSYSVEQSYLAAVRVAAKITKGSFANALSAADKSL